MKLTIKSDLSDRNLRFAAQLGVTHIMVDSGRWMNGQCRGPIQQEQLAADKQRVEARGLRFVVALLPQNQGSIHWSIRLGKQSREQEILDVCQSIESLADAGFEVIEYVFNLTGVPYSEKKALGRGGATTRQFDYTKWQDQPPDPDLYADADQIWDRIQWFLDRVIPVVECCGVKLACHPDDPPVPTLAGETRVTGSWEGMQRLIDLVPSDVNGLNFCIGTVAEMGIDTIDAIRHFGSLGRIHHVHYRNVKGAIPRFDESFLDDGDVDMVSAFRTLEAVGYRGPIMPDHWPMVEGNDSELGRAYDLGYLKALLQSR